MPAACMNIEYMHGQKYQALNIDEEPPLHMNTSLVSSLSPYLIPMAADMQYPGILGTGEDRELRSSSYKTITKPQFDH